MEPSRPICCLVCLAAVLFSGCAVNQERFIRRAAAISRIGSSNIVEVEPVRRGNLLTPITSWLGGPDKPTDRTVRLLRTWDLEQRLATAPDVVIDFLQQLVLSNPDLDSVHALAEICKLQADWELARGNTELAAGLYGTAIINAHQFLFDPDLNLKLNAYDPQFRSICDVYNRSLEGIIRQLNKDQSVNGNNLIAVGSGEFGFDLSFEIVGSWSQQAFERFELVDDYVAKGIENRYRTYGLGVPLIAVCSPDRSNTAEGNYYPPSLTIPLTAFCEVEDQQPGSTERRRAVIRLIDPLERTVVQHHGVTVPLESDLTTPLAYNLNDPLLNSGLLATATLLDGELADGIHGMYMLSPFDPEKIPVIMVHGIWSSPVTWAHMYNDLRAIPEIHENYQFWFYAYPTGQPFWISARQMREDLAKIRRDLDPGLDSPSLDETVLIGHSMGGLVSQLQVIDSGELFWKNLVSEQPFSVLKGEPENLALLRDTFFFKANDSIDQVITIGTPNRGSPVANATTKWIGKTLFTLPSTLTNDFASLARKNAQVLGDGMILTTTTSVDSLDEASPIFEVMDQAQRSRSVSFHNIIGQTVSRSLLGSTPKPSLGDGVVSIESARNRFASTEVIVPAAHKTIHQNPQCVLEVRKILTKNLVDKDRIRQREFPVIPAAIETARQRSATSGPVAK